MVGRGWEADANQGGVACDYTIPHQGGELGIIDSINQSQALVGKFMMHKLLPMSSFYNEFIIQNLVKMALWQLTIRWLSSEMYQTSKARDLRIDLHVVLYKPKSIICLPFIKVLIALLRRESECPWFWSPYWRGIRTTWLIWDHIWHGAHGCKSNTQIWLLVIVLRWINFGYLTNHIILGGGDY